METLEEAKTSLGRALGLIDDGQIKAAEPYFQVAERLLQEAIAESPTNAQAHFTYARLLEARQRYSEAEFHYQEAQRLDPTDGSIQAAYDSLRVRRQREDELAAMLQAAAARETPAPPALEAEVQVAEIAPKAEEALPIVQIPVEAEASSREANGYWALGVLNVEQGDLTGGEEAFQQALSLAPRHTRALTSYASLLLDQQRCAEAEKYLATLMEVDPAAAEACFAGRPIDSSAPLLWLRGSLHVQRGDLAAAESLLAKALELEPGRVELIVAHTRLLVDLGRSQEAVTRLHDALDRGLDDAVLHREYARLMAEQGRFDEVERHLKRALSLKPDDPETVVLRDKLQADLEAYQNASRRMALACIKAREGVMNEAEELFEEALEIDSDHLPTLKAYATFLEEQERFHDAEQIWAIVAATVPGEAKAHFQAILDARGENSETLNGLARVLIQLNDLPEAETRLRRSLDLAPGHPETLYLLANVLEKIGRSQEAEAILQDNLATVQADARLSLGYAQLLSTRRDYDRAKRLYSRAQELAPHDEEIASAYEAAQNRIAQFNRAKMSMALGLVEAQAGNYDKAKELYEEALALDQEHVPTLRYYAQMLEDTGYPIEASSYLIRLARLDPQAADEHYRSRLPQLEGSVEGRCAYANFLQNVGRPTEAVEQFCLALEVQPANPAALYPCVDLLIQEGKVREAQSSLKRALDQDDQVAETQWRYGNLLANRHRYDLAKPHLARAVELSDDPRFRESYDWLITKLAQVRQAELAWASARLETDPIVAESLFQEAYVTCPDHIQTLMDYGQFLLRQGRREEARRYLQEAVQLDPYEEQVTRLLAELEAAPPEPAEPGKEGSPDG